MTSFEIASLEKLPESSWDLPRDTTFVQLGCSSCAESVCFTARSKKHFLTDPEFEELRAITGLVDEFATVHQVSSSFCYSDRCTKPCEDGVIATAVDIINEEYGITPGLR